MKLLDLLLLAALISLCSAISFLSAPAALVVFSLGCAALWFLLGDA